MSDLFQRNAPHMSDDEDRRAWERVRQAARPVPWWAAAWQRPAVRYGLPALAVVLVAIVWVAVEQPASTHAPAPPAPAAQGAPRVAARPAEPLAAPEKKTALRRETREFATAPAPAAPTGSSAPAPGAATEQPTRAQALLKDEPVAAQSEVAPAPPPAAAGASPAPAAQSLAPAPRGGATLGVMKSTSRGDAGSAESPSPVMRNLAGARGGRADELSLDTATPGPVLAAVAAALAGRPLAFAAPLPFSLEGAGGALEAARIEVDANGAARGRLVPLGAPGQTYARYADAAAAERILLVAFSADLLGANPAPDRMALLRAEAARLAAVAGPERAAAQALVDRLSRTGK